MTEISSLLVHGLAALEMHFDSLCRRVGCAILSSDLPPVPPNQHAGPGVRAGQSMTEDNHRTVAPSETPTVNPKHCTLDWLLEHFEGWLV